LRVSSGGLVGRRGGGPEAKFRFTALFEGREFAGARVVPGEELPGSFVEFAGVEVAEQGGRCQAGPAKVEDKIDESVELALREVNPDKSSDSGFGDGDIRGEDGFGLSEGDAGGVRFLPRETVSIADGAESGDVRVDAIAEAFRFLQQFESSGAKLHDLSPKTEGPLAAFPVGNSWRTAYSSKLADPAKQSAKAEFARKIGAAGSSFFDVSQLKSISSGIATRSKGGSF